MSYYKNQPSHYIIGSATTASTLTNSYNDNTNTFDTKGYNMVTLYVTYTPGEDDSDAYVQIEAGFDSAHLFPKVALLDEDATGTSTGKQHIIKLEAVSSGIAVKRRIFIELADVKMRVSMKEITSGNYGTAKIVITRSQE
jgi:hypothetical protein